MIHGAITSEGEAIIPIRVRGPGGQEAEFEAVIDTGFNGFLTLSTELVEELALPFAGSATAALGDGNQVYLDLFEVTVLWDGQERSAIVVATGGGELIGMSLLVGNRVILEVEKGGSVIVEALRQG